MQEHGFFEMEIIDQTLIVRCFDDWNQELVARLCKEYKELVKTIYDKPWACLVDMTRWGLSTPEMWDEIDELNHWGNLNNQRFEVVICSMSIQKDLMVDSHEVLTNVETKFCETVEQAHDWLASVGVLNK